MPICLTFFVYLPILNKLEDFHENKLEQRERQEFIWTDSVHPL